MTVEIITSDLCLTSYPCQHYTRVIENGTEISNSLMSGTTIYRLYIKYNLPVDPHFQTYANHPQTNPMTIDTGSVCVKGCRHYVTLKEHDIKVGKKKLMDKKDIIELYEKHNVFLPKHFK